MKDIRGKLINCRSCGKPLIERLPNGLFKFKFGRQKNGSPWNPVMLFVHGSIKIRCFRKDCGEWNVFDYFPSGNRETEETGNDDT